MSPSTTQAATEPSDSTALPTTKPHNGLEPPEIEPQKLQQFAQTIADYQHNRTTHAEAISAEIKATNELRQGVNLQMQNPEWKRKEAIISSSDALTPKEKEQALNEIGNHPKHLRELNGLLEGLNQTKKLLEQTGDKLDTLPSEFQNALKQLKEAQSLQAEKPAFARALEAQALTELKKAYNNLPPELVSSIGEAKAALGQALEPNPTVNRLTVAQLREQLQRVSSVDETWSKFAAQAKSEGRDASELHASFLSSVAKGLVADGQGLGEKLAANPESISRKELQEVRQTIYKLRGELSTALSDEVAGAIYTSVQPTFRAAQEILNVSETLRTQYDNAGLTYNSAQVSLRQQLGATRLAEAQSALVNLSKATSYEDLTSRLEQVNQASTEVARLFGIKDLSLIAEATKVDAKDGSSLAKYVQDTTKQALGLHLSDPKTAQESKVLVQELLTARPELKTAFSYFGNAELKPAAKNYPVPVDKLDALDLGAVGEMTVHYWTSRGGWDKRLRAPSPENEILPLVKDGKANTVFGDTMDLVRIAKRDFAEVFSDAGLARGVERNKLELYLRHEKEFNSYRSVQQRYQATRLDRSN